MKSNNRGEGFTLLELLVVVAIMGILIAITIPALVPAKKKGMDDAIISNLKGMRTQSELIYTNTGCYTNSTSCSGLDTVNDNGTPKHGTVCPTSGSSIFRDPTIAQQIAKAQSASGGNPGLASCASTVGGTAWAIAVPLQSDPTKALCIDTSGTQKTGSIPSHTQTNLNAVIDGATAKCN